MKEKTTAIVTLGCIFSLFFYYKIFSPDQQNVAENNSISEIEIVQHLVEKVESKNVENLISESPVETGNSSDESKSECLLIQDETDSMSFSDSFKYYRKCNGQGTLFTWKNNEYSTFLASEKITIKKDPIVNQTTSTMVVDPVHLDLHKEVLNATVGNK